jgi:hypothetical protein
MDANYNTTALSSPPCIWNPLVAKKIIDLLATKFIDLLFLSTLPGWNDQTLYAAVLDYLGGVDEYHFQMALKAPQCASFVQARSFNADPNLGFITAVQGSIGLMKDQTTTLISRFIK